MEKCPDYEIKVYNSFEFAHDLKIGCHYRVKA